MSITEPPPATGLDAWTSFEVWDLVLAALVIARISVAFNVAEPPPGAAARRL
jgi:hypothetical protein